MWLNAVEKTLHVGLGWSTKCARVAAEHVSQHALLTLMGKDPEMEDVEVSSDEASLLRAISKEWAFQSPFFKSCAGDKRDL